MLPRRSANRPTRWSGGKHGKRERAAKAGCRFDEIEAEWNPSTGAVCRLLEEAADYRATTLDGLRCKARLNDIEVDMGHEVASASIVDDLLATSAPA